MSDHRMIGLDIGSGSVRAADITVGHGTVRLHNFGQVSLPPGAVVGGDVIEPLAVTLAIKKLWKERKFSHRKVVLGVANQQVVVRAMDLPHVESGDLKRSLPFLVADVLALAVDEAVLDFLPLDSDAEEGKTVRGLLVASPKATVATLVKCVEAAGLRPLSVDLASFAVLRALGRGRLFNAAEKVDERRKPGPATEVLVDIGGTVSHIVVHRGGVPQIVRIVLRGGADITAVLSERLGISVADAESLKLREGLLSSNKTTTNLISLAVTPLIQEIRSSMEYYASTQAGGRIERVRLCGGGSLLPGLIETVSKDLGVHAEAADPLWDVTVEGKDVNMDELNLARFKLAVPVGLALSAA